MYIGEPVKELVLGDYKAVYTGEDDICRQCYIKGFTEAVRPPKKQA